jgi:acyl-coenzyme A synthetase/AMP-(fatty) acid ligase/acyl carrier protein
VLAGEALEFQSLRSWLNYYPQSRFVNMYGPTETTVHSTYHPLTLAEINDRETRSRIGKALPDLKVHVLDKEMQMVPIGVKGEIYIGGPGLARGYLDRPELTADRFLPDPFSEWQGERMYRTGDQGSRRADGSLEYFGRLDMQVKIRGYRIELGEIESALLDFPGAKQCVVIVREDVPGEKKLVAYLVADEEVTTGELRDHLKNRLPEYMIPSAFVILEAMPLTPNRKIDRRALPAPTAMRGLDETNYVVPRTQLEEAVAGIWADVLHLERVGAEDNFFALGGHSLLATQIMSRIRETFNLEVPLRSLFESPTVASTARAIEAMQNEAEEKPSGPAIKRLERKRTALPGR